LYRAQGVFTNYIGENTMDTSTACHDLSSSPLSTVLARKHQIILVIGVDKTCMGHNNQKMEMRHQERMKKLFMKIIWR
jgi:hypothetical protein